MYNEGLEREQELGNREGLELRNVARSSGVYFDCDRMRDCRGEDVELSLFLQIATS